MPIYGQFYGLRESPFALTPDPRCLFLSDSHKEALASAIYGIQERKGFVLILGEVGTGKTTLVRHLLGRFGPDTRAVLVFNPAVSFLELLQLILRDLELPCPALRRVEMIDTLNEYLLKEAAAGRCVVLIIDEAQHLSPGVLEEVRMLSNLETARGKLLQILLVGQPELGEKLGRPELRQIRQRISLVAELQPLSYEDTARYIAHRLEAAGRAGKPIFTRRALKITYRASGGIPRLINAICDKALVLGYGAGAATVKGRVVKEVLKDWAAFRRRSASSARARRRAAGPRIARPWTSLWTDAAAVVLLGAAGIGLAVALAGVQLGDLPAHLWRDARAAGEAVAADASAASVSAPSASPPADPPVLEAGAPEVRLPERPVRQAASSLPRGARKDTRALPAADQARQVIVKPGEYFSGLVQQNYGRADLTLLDFVRAANPDVGDIDLLRVGQRLKLPAFEPAALVERSAGSRYRLHLITVWETQSPAYQKVQAAVDKLGKRVHVVPVNLTRDETAYRVMVGDFADRREAQTFYRTRRLPDLPVAILGIVGSVREMSREQDL